MFEHLESLPQKYAAWNLKIFKLFQLVTVLFQELLAIFLKIEKIDFFIPLFFLEVLKLMVLLGVLKLVYS